MTEEERLRAMLHGLLEALEEIGRLPYVLKHLSERQTAMSVQAWWEDAKCRDAARAEERRVADVMRSRRLTAIRSLSTEDIKDLGLHVYEAGRIVLQERGE